jgi:RimJ/RimL family protein N-acetyltransferase
LTEQTRPTGPRFIIGERITLRSIERDDLPHVRRWLDDPELRRQIGARSPLSEAESVEWFERISADPARAWYVIVVDEDERVVGEAGLLRMDPEWRTTDMTVIVGEPDARGQGYGREAAELVLDFAFQYMGFHRVAIGVVGFHDGALRFWERLGFKREGLQREGYLLEGRFHDFVMMSILDEEWRATRGAEEGAAG